MKKFLMLALCLALAGFVAVNGSYAMPDVAEVFQDLTEYLGDVLGIPAYSTQGEIDVQIVLGREPDMLYPGCTAQTTLSVHNDGSQTAYFRLAVAVQYDAATWDDKFTVAFEAADSYTVLDWMDITISGTPYRMKVFTYNEALGSNEQSSNITMTVSLAANVTNEELARYHSDFVQMKVLAIETAAFDDKAKAENREPSAQTALDRALPLTDFNPF